ncbi:MAG: DNA alkylation repair protein [Bacillaceae bacterium]
MEKMLCPACKTNRMRFYIIDQEPKAVKLNPQTGDVEEEFTADNVDPFFVAYKGPTYKVQCGVCGLIENPELFEKAAQL